MRCRRSDDRPTSSGLPLANARHGREDRVQAPRPRRSRRIPTDERKSFFMAASPVRNWAGNAGHTGHTTDRADRSGRSEGGNAPWPSPPCRPRRPPRAAAWHPLPTARRPHPAGHQQRFGSFSEHQRLACSSPDSAPRGGWRSRLDTEDGVGRRIEMLGSSESLCCDRWSTPPRRLPSTRWSPADTSSTHGMAPYGHVVECGDTSTLSL